MATTNGSRREMISLDVAPTSIAVLLQAFHRPPQPESEEHRTASNPFTEELCLNWVLSRCPIMDTSWDWFQPLAYVQAFDSVVSSHSFHGSLRRRGNPTDSHHDHTYIYVLVRSRGARHPQRQMVDTHAGETISSSNVLPDTDSHR